MLPLVLAAVGGYLVYDSFKKPVKYADGGMMDDGGMMAKGGGVALSKNGKKVFNVFKKRRKIGISDYVSADKVGILAKKMNITLSEKEMNDVADLYNADNLGFMAESMMTGGDVTFEEKVDAVKKSLLKRKKVSPKVQKDYGKTYSPKEAEDSAKRIVGSQMK